MQYSVTPVDYNPFEKAGGGLDIKEVDYNPFESQMQSAVEPEEPERTVGGTLKDVAISAGRGVVGLGEAAVGLADIPTFGRVGKAMGDYLGYDPEATNEFLGRYYSAAQKEANLEVEKAEGLGGKLKAMLKHPSTIGHAVVESAPLMGGGAAAARTLLAKGLLASPLVAGAVGEGLVSAGSSAEQVRQQTEDGLLTLKQSLIPVTSGAGTSVFALAGGRIAQKMGLIDVDTFLAGGGNVTKIGVVKRIIGGGISEGAFEELPQSMQEQIWLNAALDKPLMEGVPEAGATGGLVGTAMGAGFNIFTGRATDAPEQAPDPQQALAEIKAGLEAGTITPEQALESAQNPGVQAMGIANEIADLANEYTIAREAAKPLAPEAEAPTEGEWVSREDYLTRVEGLPTSEQIRREKLQVATRPETLPVSTEEEIPEAWMVPEALLPAPTGEYEGEGFETYEKVKPREGMGEGFTLQEVDYDPFSPEFAQRLRKALPPGQGFELVPEKKAPPKPAVSQEDMAEALARNKAELEKKPAEKVEAKEPWEMTKGEFTDAVRNGRDFKQIGVKPTPLSTLRAAKDYDAIDRQAKGYHEGQVISAFASNKSVPAEVLKDYPELTAKAEPDVGAQEVPAKPSPGSVFIKNKQFPFREYRELTRGKNEGKVEIILPDGKKKIVEKADVAKWPEGGEVEAKKPDPDKTELLNLINELSEKGKEYKEGDVLTEALGGEKFSYKTRQLRNEIRFLLEERPDLSSLVPSKLYKYFEDFVGSFKPAVDAAKSRIVSALKSQRGSFSMKQKEGPAVYEDLLTVGKHYINQGYTKWSGFRLRMKDALSEIWDKVRGVISRVFVNAKKILKSEKGAVTIEAKAKKTKIINLLEKRQTKGIRKVTEPSSVALDLAKMMDLEKGWLHTINMTFKEIKEVRKVLSNPVEISQRSPEGIQGLRDGIKELEAFLIPDVQQALSEGKPVPAEVLDYLEADKSEKGAVTIEGVKGAVAPEAPYGYGKTKTMQEILDDLGIAPVGEKTKPASPARLSTTLRTRFGRGYVKPKDIKLFNRTFELPYWLAKRFDSMKALVRKEIEMAEKRQGIVFRDYEKDLGKIQEELPKDKKTLKEFNGLIWKWDGKRFPKEAVPTNWHDVVTPGEDITINQKHYVEVEAYLKKQGASPKAIEAFLTVRKTLDEKLADIDKTLHTDKMDPSLIQEFRSSIGEVHNYFPHRRTGDAYVQIIDPETDTLLYREHYSTLKDRLLSPEKKARARAQAWLIRKKGKNIDQYKIRQGKVTQLPDEVFFQIPIDAMQQLMEVTGRSLSDSRVKREAERLARLDDGLSYTEALKKARKILTADMEAAISKAFADTLKARGWGRHAILRKGIPGHETEDVFGILFDYLTGYAGFKTKIERARHHAGVMHKINAKKNPGEYKYCSKYVHDVLANQDRIDRLVDGIRGLFFVKYLGFVVKSGIVNLTQNVVLAAPILSVHTKGSHIKLARAMKDVRKALVSKNAFLGKEVKYPHLSDNEQKALHELIESGAGMDLFLRELQGNLPGRGWGKYFKKFVTTSGIFMRVAEKFNRASTGLAAYRVALNEGTTLADGTQTRGDHEASMKFAKRVIYDSHFLYGKSNLPEIVRGGDIQKILRSGYTFRSFTHNYLGAMAHLVSNQGREGKQAFARSLRNLFIVGGLTSIPFFKAFSEALMWALGDDDEDTLTKIRSEIPAEWLKDLVTYGLPGVAGHDLTGSLSIEFPRNWKEIIGVPYSIGEDIWNTTRSIASGQVYRAASETPFTPIAVRNAMRGLELYTTGQRTRSGKDISYPSEVGPRKIKGLEAVTKGLVGLQPVSVSKGYKSYQATARMERGLQERKSRWADRYVNAYRKNDRARMKKIIDEVLAWNAKARKDDKPWRQIDLKAAVEYRMRPGYKVIPKGMRRRAVDISRQWGAQ